MKKGVRIFVDMLKDKKYSIYNAHQATKDFDLLMYFTQRLERMSDEDILNLFENYGCPKYEDFNMKYTTRCIGCQNCWKEFLERLCFTNNQ